MALHRRNLIAAALFASLGLAPPAIAQTRQAVEATAPTALTVTVYRDPDRAEGEALQRNDPRGFAMISETRQVTLPPGESTIRFTGVAEGMVAVSAIVTGLPGGTIEKNRNADLLSPAALVDGTLGNRVTVTRTNPATGEEQVDSAVIRTRADGGLVLETAQGFEAVRCAGLPERLTFDRAPDGLSAQPVFSIDTRDDRGGTYTVTLTYLAWGFDWEANYVATLAEGGSGDEVTLRLMSWLTIVNDNNQTFADAELMAVAGTLNVVSDFEDLAEPPEGRPLQLTCYPLGSTAAGSPVPTLVPPPPPPMPMAAPIVVTARRRTQEFDSASPMVAVNVEVLAQEEQLGDLKLYRIPERLTVGAKGMKQVAFLDQGAVRGRLLYRADCWPGINNPAATTTEMLLATVNDDAHGLGMALPSGRMTVFEPSSSGELLVAQPGLRDYAEGQDVELSIGESSQVMTQCSTVAEQRRGEMALRRTMRAVLTNANPGQATVRMVMGRGSQVRISGLRTQLKDGHRIFEVTVPANGARQLEWTVEESR